MFLVFWSCLTQLLQRCTICCSPASIEKKIIKGTMIIVDLLCKNNHRFTWRSQSLKNGMAFGNIKLSAAILFSGNTFQQIKEMTNISNVSFLGQSTFYCIQQFTEFIQPIELCFIENAKEKSEVLHLLGDGRCDSPRYNSKYGTSTLMDSQSGYILDFHISHVRLAGNSQKMELDGFKKVASDSKTLASKSEASLQIGTSRFEHTCENS